MKKLAIALLIGSYVVLWYETWTHHETIGDMLDRETYG